MKRSSTLVIGASTLLAIAVLIGGGSLWFAQRDAQRQFAALQHALLGDLDRFLPQLLEDQFAAADEPLLAPAIGEHDAGPFLNPRIVWRGEPQLIEDWRRRQAERPDLLQIDPAIRRQLDSWSGDSWTEHATEIDLAAIPLDWFAQLPQFDLWDLERNSPLAEFERYPVEAVPVPDAWTLVRLSRLRLLRGIRDQAVAAAVSEVVALCRLLQSTENLAAVMTAHQILYDLEPMRFAAATTDERLPVPLPRRQTIERAQRATRALPALLQLTTPVGLSAVLLAPQAPTLGRCAALNEALWSALFLRPYLGQTLADRYAELDQLLAGNGQCRLRNLRQQWQHPSSWARHALEQSPDRSGSLPWLRGQAVPWVDSIVGYRLASLASPDWFAGYRR